MSARHAVRIEINDNAVSRVLSQLTGAIGNPHPLLADMGECMLALYRNTSAANRMAWLVC